MPTLLLHAMAAGLLVTFASDDARTDAADTRQPDVRPGAHPALAPPDACALLTQVEAEAILGQPIDPPVKGGSGECHYAARSGSAEILVYVMPLAFKSKEEFHAFLVKDTEAMNARVKKDLKSTGATVKETTVDPVPEVGEPAYFVDPSLVVLKHSRVLNIIAADRRQAVAVAAKVLPRFE
jgi:hypothetical protein